MKKLVILTIAAILSIASVSMAKTLAPWDYPLSKRVWNPTVASLYLTCSATDIVIASELNQPGIEDGHTWRMTIPTKAYVYMLIYGHGLPHYGWQWVTWLYTLDFCSSCLTSTETLQLNYQDKFITYSGTFGYGGVRDDQYYISSFNPI